MTSVTQGPVVQKADNKIYPLDLYQVDNSIIAFSKTYLLDSNLSGG